ncbi:acyltransferase-domain-containing protein [Gorgonomyces haynaldii]|nr:acyltransferase-domain-containing protein [Gorgonomyces haynaldii]
MDQSTRDAIIGWCYVRYKFYIRLTEMAFGSLLLITGYLFVPGRIIFTGDIENMKQIHQSIVIANHQIFPDFFYLWLAARRFNHHGDVKILLMKVLKYIPLAGWGMRFFEFIFLERKLKLDRKIIMRNITRHKRYFSENPLWLLLFPEGTLNTPNNRVTSRAFAKKMDISDDPKFVILPKATGVFMCADTLMPQVNTLFDITVGYSGLKQEQIPYEEYLIENCFFAGQYPKEVHMHIRTFQLQQVDGFDGKITQESIKGEEIQATKESEAFDPLTNSRREAFSIWLRKRFMEKDALLERFYEHGSFESEHRLVWQFKPQLMDWLLVLITWITLPLLLPFYLRLIWALLLRIYSLF